MPAFHFPPLNIPRLARALESLRKIRVAELLFQKKSKVRLARDTFPSFQSRIRSRAVSRSRAGMARPLLRLAVDGKPSLKSNFARFERGSSRSYAK